MTNMNSKGITWRRLKKFCDSLTEDQLKKKVWIWGNEWGGTICDLDILKEDHINPSGNGVEPVSAYIQEYPDILESEEIIFNKGQAILITQ